MRHLLKLWLVFAFAGCTIDANDLPTMGLNGGEAGDAGGDISSPQPNADILVGGAMDADLLAPEVDDYAAGIDEPLDTVQACFADCIENNQDDDACRARCMDGNHSDDHERDGRAIVEECQTLCDVQASEILDDCLEAGLSEDECEQRSAQALTRCRVEICGEGDEPGSSEHPRDACEADCNHHAQDARGECLDEQGDEEVCDARAEGVFQGCFAAACGAENSLGWDEPESSSGEDEAASDYCAEQCADDPELIFRQCRALGEDDESCHARRQDYLIQCVEAACLEVEQLSEAIDDSALICVEACMRLGEDDEVCQIECAETDPFENEMANEGLRDADGEDEFNQWEDEAITEEDAWEGCIEACFVDSGAEAQCNARCEALFEADESEAVSEWDRCFEACLDTRSGHEACILRCDEDEENSQRMHCDAECGQLADLAFEDCRDSGASEGECELREARTFEICLEDNCEFLNDVEHREPVESCFNECLDSDVPQWFCAAQCTPAVDGVDREAEMNVCIDECVDEGINPRQCAPRCNAALRQRDQQARRLDIDDCRDVCIEDGGDDEECDAGCNRIASEGRDSELPGPLRSCFRRCNMSDRANDECRERCVDAFEEQNAEASSTADENAQVCQEVCRASGGDPETCRHGCTDAFESPEQTDDMYQETLGDSLEGCSVSCQADGGRPNECRALCVAEAEVMICLETCNLREELMFEDCLLSGAPIGICEDRVESMRRGCTAGCDAQG